MKLLQIWITTCSIALASMPVFADKLDESFRPRDYSRDFQVPAAPMATMATVLGENFDGTFPPTGWTVVDNAPGGPVWGDLAGCGESGNFTNGSGGTACVSSDQFGSGEFDTELRTPAIDFSSITAPAALTFTANYQNYASLDFFNVDVSTDGGASWANLLSWNEDHGSFRAPPGVDVNLDISAYAGQSDVRFRFHYFDPNSGDWDWYAQVDNVDISGTVAVATTDLALSLSASPNPVVVGSSATFTATSTNLGPADAQNVMVNLTLGPDFSYGSHAAAGSTSCTAPPVGQSGTISCTWAGATAATVQRVLVVNAVSRMQGTAMVGATTSSDTSDSNAANNSATVSVSALQTSVAIPALDWRGLALLGLAMGLVGMATARRH